MQSFKFSITISYSDIQGGEAGIVTNNNGSVNWLEGNIDEDPLFVIAGDYLYSWDRTNQDGNSVANGIYFCRLIVGDYCQTQKLILSR